MNDLQDRFSLTQIGTKTPLSCSRSQESRQSRSKWVMLPAMLGSPGLLLCLGMCFRVCLCICLGVALTACQTITGVRSDDGTLLLKPSGPGLVAQSQSLIPDVPTPVGFVGVPSKSTSYVAADGVRIVDHTYQGRASMVDAVQFYRLHLPQNGWQRVREQSEARATFMTFTKGRETLTLQIADQRVMNVLVSIRGAPQTTPQRTPQPSGTTTVNQTPQR